QDINASLDCELNNDLPCAGTLSGESVSATEGQSATATTATFQDSSTGTNSQYTATVDWGDGTGSSAGTVTNTAAGTYDVSGTNTYGEEGSYTITTTLYKGTTVVASTNSIATVADGGVSAPNNNIF